MASITVTFKIQIYKISEFVAIKMDTAAVCNEYATHHFKKEVISPESLWSHKFSENMNC